MFSTNLWHELASCFQHVHVKLITRRPCMHVLLDAGYLKKLAGSPCTFGAQHRTTVGIVIVSRTQDSACTFSTSNPTRRFIIDQTLELEEYHSNRQSDLGTLLPSSPTSTRDKRVVTIMLWDTSSNQVSHIHNSIFN
jgi:hypothetical protein